MAFYLFYCVVEKLKSSLLFLGCTHSTSTSMYNIPLTFSALRLQITAVLASKYPSIVPRQELVPLLSVLCQLLAEQRRGERGPYVLRCLREVARCQAHYPESAQVHKTELGRLWGRVWALALRGVSSPQTEALSLDLLSSIVHGGLINMDRELWKLFSGSACKPSQWVPTIHEVVFNTENVSFVSAFRHPFSSLSTGVQLSVSPRPCWSVPSLKVSSPDQAGTMWGSQRGLHPLIWGRLS